MLRKISSNRFLLLIALAAVLAMLAACNTSPNTMPRAGNNMSQAITPTPAVESEGSIVGAEVVTNTVAVTDTVAMTGTMDITNTVEVTETAEVAAASAPTEPMIRATQPITENLPTVSVLLKIGVNPETLQNALELGEGMKFFLIEEDETAQVQTGTLVAGDVMVGSTKLHDNDGKTGLLVVVLADSQVFADWGAAVSNLHNFDQVLADMLAIGCGREDTGGCDMVVVKEVTQSGPSTLAEISDEDLQQLRAANAEVAPSAAMTDTAPVTSTQAVTTAVAEATTVPAEAAAELPPIAIKAGVPTSIPAGYTCNADARVDGPEGQKLYDEGDGSADTASIIAFKVNGQLWSEWEGGCNGESVEWWKNQVGENAIVYTITANGVEVE